MTYPYHDVAALGTIVTLRNDGKATLAPLVLADAIKVFHNVYVMVPAVQGYVKAIKSDLLVALKSNGLSGPTFVHIHRKDDMSLHDLYID